MAFLMEQVPEPQTRLKQRSNGKWLVFDQLVSSLRHLIAVLVPSAIATSSVAGDIGVWVTICVLALVVSRGLITDALHLPRLRRETWEPGEVIGLSLVFGIFTLAFGKPIFGFMINSLPPWRFLLHQHSLKTPYAKCCSPKGGYSKQHP
jgi:hypothetical protein